MEKRIEGLNLDKIAASGQCFRWRRVGEQAYEIPLGESVLRIARRAQGVFDVDCDEAAWQRLWSPYFDLESDYGAYLASIDLTDEYLRAAAKAGEGIRILRQPLWETTASFIVSQNNNIPRIQGILRRLCGGGDAFPEPARVAAMSEEGLRALGLGYRAAYLREAARRFVEERPETTRPPCAYGEDRAWLQGFLGIGPKVADCICLYGLGHKEAFPMDVWMKRIVREHYAGCFPLWRYQGFAGVLQQYLFYYERLHA